MAYFGVVLGLKYLSTPYISPLGRVKIPSKKPTVKRYIYTCIVMSPSSLNPLRVPRRFVIRVLPTTCWIHMHRDPVLFAFPVHGVVFDRACLRYTGHFQFQCLLVHSALWKARVRVATTGVDRPTLGKDRERLADLVHVFLHGILPKLYQMLHQLCAFQKIFHVHLHAMKEQGDVGHQAHLEREERTKLRGIGVLDVCQVNTADVEDENKKKEQNET